MWVQRIWDSAKGILVDGKYYDDLLMVRLI
jgi:hypothetical protein